MKNSQRNKLHEQINHLTKFEVKDLDNPKLLSGKVPTKSTEF